MHHAHHYSSRLIQDKNLILKERYNGKCVIYKPILLHESLNGEWCVKPRAQKDAERDSTNSHIIPGINGFMCAGAVIDIDTNVHGLKCSPSTSAAPTEIIGDQ